MSEKYDYYLLELGDIKEIQEKFVILKQRSDDSGALSYKAMPETDPVHGSFPTLANAKLNLDILGITYSDVTSRFHADFPAKKLWAKQVYKLETNSVNGTAKKA